ncbi:LuxR family maltose regulon positive regulatory protein [Solirubrobacter pauli]|uniref:LuxR family maltose regulon positive regulatory protein n=1 Tax=Solirubrobacter pauli TaxID=166793 RepID=A0A660L529_9ACTN|nr:LuxR C-terminal-related transcriptional regulator [Solirubrobacter pauli]RKQ87033.1 LuxR family maltose regulon positive regulatory protein [Solirubrobacter pauli]
MVVDTVPALVLHPTRHATPSGPPPPLPGPGTVPRARLVRRLVDAQDARIAVLAAPAGYGKSTLVSEWALRDDRPFAYVALAGAHDERLTRLLARSAPAGGQVLVVDDAQHASPDVLRGLLETAATWPRGRTLALVSRWAPPGPIGRWRAHRRVVEIGPEDLAMTHLEAAMLVAATGLRLEPAQVDLLLGRTQGWPAALYLAARTLAQAPDPQLALGALSGGEPLLASFLRDDVLGALTPGQRAFARRCSVLEELSAPACDAVLDTHGSGPALEELVRRGLPLTASDACTLRLAVHPLLAGMLRAERARVEPELESTLQRRAALWHAAEAHPRPALTHALAAGDTPLAGRLLWALARPAAAGLPTEPLEPWMPRFDARAVAANAPLALAVATHRLLTGRRAAAERALDAAERALAARTAPADGRATHAATPSGPADERATVGATPDVRAGERAAHPAATAANERAAQLVAPPGFACDDGAAAVALLRACLAQHGLEDMAADAAQARTLLPPWSPWHALALLLAGVAAHLGGDADAAAPLLEEAADRADELPVVAALAHAQLALTAADRDAWDEAAECAATAHAALTTGVPGAVRALVLATGAVVAAQRGDIAQARHDAVDARRLLAARTDFVPWVLAEAEIWLARAEILLSDGPAARGGLTRAAHLQPRVPGDRTLERWIHDGWARADAFAETATGDGPMLTNAELRVLRLLPSHMSFREIGQRLHVSTNTVKTQALAVYRKLDVSCRSDAVARGRSAGLIGEA